MINLLIRKINNINYAKTLLFFVISMFITTFKGANNMNLVGDKLGYFYPWNIRSNKTHGKGGQYSFNLVASLQSVQWIASTTCSMVWGVYGGRDIGMCTQHFEGL